MALIRWDDRLALNVSEIDRQHQKLVELMNDLDAAMRLGRGNEVVGRILDGLINYTQYHFDAEEALLEEHGYPGTPTHKHEHGAFVRKMADFKVDYAAGQASLSIGVMTFLSDWLRNHIMGTDREYAPHLTARGVR